MNILLATSNSHKLGEVQAILGLQGIVVVGLNETERLIDEPIEDADTFAGNARLKAAGYAKATGKRCMADDSGLVVDALGGEPGIFSARYAGIGESREERDAANNELLLTNLSKRGESESPARFVCALCVADPDGTIVAESEGAFEGVITTTPRGVHGFGYDPLLFLPDVGMTSAELSEEEKNARSHRSVALRKIIPLIT
ncbi:MAG: RdgB/HAM1 family non-canonical purine NTP pyrophosphatase [Planctomycetes bacterium]|nr:RdgB/HAM1 family non-canonical purine NTP pyrophosphatase [Planctomycetota bacterium]